MKSLFSFRLEFCVFWAVRLGHHGGLKLKNHASKKVNFLKGYLTENCHFHVSYLYALVSVLKQSE